MGIRTQELQACVYLKGQCICRLICYCCQRVITMACALLRRLSSMGKLLESKLVQFDYIQHHHQYCC